MQAVSSGKVVNPYDRDQEQGWDHVDFVIDALLSEGNSGSPVLAASCKSRELELVGVYHAGYKGHSALNVVVGIDQLAEFMTQEAAHAARDRLGRIARARPGSTERGARQGHAGRRDAAAVRFRRPRRARRDRPTAACSSTTSTGGSSRSTTGASSSSRICPRPAAFGELGRLWVLGPTGWREWPPSALGGDERDMIGARRRLHPPADPAHPRLSPRAGEPRLRRRAPPRPRGVAHDRARRSAGARPGQQPARDRGPAVVRRPRHHRARAAPLVASRPRPPAPRGAP